MASSTQWTWVCTSSGRQWRTGKPGVLQCMGSPRVGHDWLNEQKQYPSLPMSVTVQFSSVQFSHSVVSNSFWLHELQRARLPRPSLSPGACSNLCPLSQWCHLTISSYVTPFSSCPQSFPMSRLLESGGQSTGASASVLPMNIQGW